MKKIIVLLITAALIGLFTVFFLGPFFCGTDILHAMSKASELTPSSQFVTANYASLKKAAYNAMNTSIYELEKKSDLEALRIFAVKNGKCWFAATDGPYSDNHRSLYLYSIHTDGKNSTLIREFTVSRLPWMDDFVPYSNKDRCPYSWLLAYYYDEKIVVNEPETVYEYDLTTESFTEHDRSSYEYPENKANLEYSYDNAELTVYKDGQSYTLNWYDLIQGSPEMKFLYDITDDKEKASFFGYITYYDAEPYIVCVPRNKYGIACGALFRFDPAANSVDFINCIYTNEYPDYTYPVRLE